MQLVNLSSYSLGIPNLTRYEVDGVFNDDRVVTGVCFQLRPNRKFFR